MDIGRDEFDVESDNLLFQREEVFDEEQLRVSGRGPGRDLC